MASPAGGLALAALLDQGDGGGDRPQDAGRVGSARWRRPLARARATARSAAASGGSGAGARRTSGAQASVSRPRPGDLVPVGRAVCLAERAAVSSRSTSVSGRPRAALSGVVSSIRLADVSAERERQAGRRLSAAAAAPAAWLAASTSQHGAGQRPARAAQRSGSPRTPGSGSAGSKAGAPARPKTRARTAAEASGMLRASA